MKRLLTMPSPAMGVALLALFISLSGAAYAAATIGSDDVRDGSLKGVDLRANTITDREIKARSIDGTDIKIDRVGNNAVKEEVLDASKLRKVPNATAADTATTATNLAGATAGTTKTAADLDTRWALINENGAIEQQTGGFAIRDCYQTNANCYIDTGEDARNNAINAQIAIQNVDGIPASTRLNGETGTAPCGADFVACAPPNTEDNNVIVVAPRDSTGAAPAAPDRFRFYVFVTGSQAG